jgi:hypothetical protein
MAILLLLFVVLILLIWVVMIAAFWRIYEKAGQPGWASIIPIYNFIVWLKIINKPWWWLLLLLVPLVNIVIIVWSINLLMKAFGKSEGWTIGALLVPYIIYPLLAWGDARYQGEVAAEDHPDILDAGVR